MKPAKAWGIKYSNGKISRWTYPLKHIAEQEHQTIYWGDNTIEVIRVEIREVKK